MKSLSVAIVAIVLIPTAAAAQIAISANESKVTLENGVVTTVKNPPPDTVTIIDLAATPPKVLAELPVPASIVGPPESVAIAPDDSIALVTAATRIDPKDPSRTVPDDRVTVIDLKVSPPAVLATLHAGAGASGVSFNPSGTLALVANRIEGTVSLFTVAGKIVTAAGKVDLGAPESGPAHVAFTRDGRSALVTRNNDSFISILSVTGSTVAYTKRDLAAGLKPYSIEISPAADVAVVGNTGAGPSGGADTLSVIDLGVDPPRAIGHVTVGPTAEGVGISHDGRWVAVTVMNGSNSPKTSPFFNQSGRLKVFGLANKTLTPVADVPVGRWCQGAVFSRDGKTVAVQCAADREILVFRFDGKALSPAGSIKVNGGPAGMRTGR
jgi:DNA-binding beta-propeller fold protein YncE